jgi:hypothetical protein
MSVPRHGPAVAPDGLLRVPAGGAAARTPYPDFDVASLTKWDLDWDDKTRKLVRERVTRVPAYRLLTPHEAALLEAACARLVPQDDRPSTYRVPIAPWIDDRLTRGESAGYRYDGMPSDEEAYRRGLAGIDEAAHVLHQHPFGELTADLQDAVLGLVAQGEPPGAAWRSLPAARFFDLLLDDVLTYYYAHPAAWAEIGFSGPSSPRGHMRLDLGRRDPWEGEERRPRSSVDIVRRARGPRGSGGQPTH